MSASRDTASVDFAAHLRASFLFTDLGSAELHVLAAGCRAVHLGPGEVLLRQGEPGDEMFLVTAGRLRVTHRDGADEVVLGEVGRGEHLGEIALLRSVARTATATALGETRLLALSRATVETLVAAHPESREKLVTALEHRLAWAAKRRLRPDPGQLAGLLGEMMGGIAREALAGLESELEWVTLPRGTIFIREGEPGDCLYFLSSGRLRVFTRREDGSEAMVGEVGPGESLGEMALLSSAPRSAWVATLEDSELLRLSKAGFERLLAEHPQAMGIFTRMMLARLNKRNPARAAMAQLRAAPFASPEECDETVRTPNLVLRNLKITQMYHRLSQQLALLLGDEDANWCTFACNASKTAGYAIRREELPFVEMITLARRRAWVRRGADRVGAWAKDTPLVRRAQSTLDAVSETISAGNLKVFAELGPIFARFVREFHGDREYSLERLEAFTAQLEPGPTSEGGQELLREALRHYYDAAFETRPKARAELVLLGNIKVGLHEQTRLQPNIVAALNAPLTVGIDGAVSSGLLGPVLGLLPSRAATAARGGLGTVERLLATQLTHTFRRLVTRSMMTLRLPYGEVRLGADVPRLPDDRMFPYVLQELELPELVALVGEFDASPGSLSGSRASDWGNLGDRMTFIVDLFRSRQRSLELFGQPFEHDQRGEIAADRVPPGHL
ncbi:MAG: cyclic nucleotide-binding domain-containing protein [Myxococcaceae bacterium]